MTVPSKLKNTLAILEGVHADFKTLYIETPNGKNKDMFNGFVLDIEDMMCKVKNRLDKLEKEEPKYKENKQMTNYITIF